MRQIIVIVFPFILLGCTNFDQRERELQNEIDHLKEIIHTMHKPGYGDFMGNIQNHHNKLWFAGINENWELAYFEIHELEEIFENIQVVHSNREETQLLPMIEPGVEAIKKAINEKSKENFQKGYTLLTNSCNTCHKATNHEFIRIKTPEVPSYSNQDYISKSPHNQNE